LPGTEWDDKEKGYFAGKNKKPKNDQFAGDFEKNSLVAGLLLFGSSWRRRLSTAETAELASQKVLDKPDIFSVLAEECAERIKYRTKNVACTLR